jgi:hypothetical protein
MSALAKVRTTEVGGKPVLTGSGRAPAGDKFRGSGTQKTVGGPGANEVGGAISEVGLRTLRDTAQKKATLGSS